MTALFVTVALGALPASPGSRLLAGERSRERAPAADLAPSGHRVALLLGNAGYEGFTLRGVKESLDRLEESLESRGFRVVRREDLGEKEQREVVEGFAASVPTNGAALLYYVGLGAQVERLGNYYDLLRPVGVSIDGENDYRSRALDVADLLESLSETSGARVGLVFLDASWESPIKPETEKVQGGLRELEVPRDTVVMFATPSAETLAAPRSDTPSRLATALSRHLDELDRSVKGACEAIAAELENPWFGGAVDRGIGAPPARPLAEELREGKIPGEGFVNSIGMTFRWCPPGSFTMGSTETGSPATRDREPAEVTLSRGFWMGEHEVTQREYRAVRGRSVPRGFTVHKNAPFWGVREPKEIAQFSEKLTEIEREAGTLPEGWEYACPTEAEWEYACRAGSTAAYSFGDSVTELGRYANFADRKLHAENPNYHWADLRTDDGVGEALAPVGSYRPNAWGLRDMHGNVAEIVADHLLPRLPGGTDPLARAEKDGITQIRGGAWCSLSLYCESSFRNRLPGRDKHDFVGFRVVIKKVAERPESVE